MRSSVRVAAVILSLAFSAASLAGCATDEADGPAVASDPSALPLGLVSHVDVASAWLGKDDRVVVHWSMTNQGEVALSVPHWEVPSATIEENIFTITRDGEPVRYYGKLAKRLEPRPEDLVEIAPGQTLAADVELSAFYRMGRAGEYAIEHAEHHLPVFVAGEPQIAELRSNQVATLRMDENPGADSPKSGVHSDVVSSGYQGCSSSQKTKITNALNSAQSYALNAESYMNSGTRGARYTTWFGSYTSSRYARVRSHYASIRDVIQNERMVFDCTCTDSGTYAYVYPDDPYVEYFCGAFWSAPNTGTDSRAGTIIHETSHFTVVAGTNDWTYGQSSCKSLARTNPSHAVDNADSHEYFAENNPAQN
jgi:peptidyl-Lys metalloendopeptidase